MPKRVSLSIGFKPVARKDARFLILGTLPGVESLKRQAYYAHKQNSFWKIMGELAGAHPHLTYRMRLEQLRRNRIALWDVLAAAARLGSLDAAIQAPVPNDLARFLKKHPQIELICFNGKGAEAHFFRHIFPIMPEREFRYVVLPSTSPAYASMSYRKKLSFWRRALQENAGTQAGIFIEARSKNVCGKAKHKSAMKVSSS
jgi:hypoxanthine-DNA glycosylase